MFGRLPEIGQWQRALIRASQLTIVIGLLLLLTVLFAPQKFDHGIFDRLREQPLYWAAGVTLWLVLLLYAWTRQAMMVSRVVNNVFAHVREYANEYDVLMRSTLRRNRFTPPDQINTLDELTRFINAMMQQALRDQQRLGECIVALGEERLQRSTNERQTQYVRGGVSRVLHDGKDIHNDIMYLLDDLARSDAAAQREVMRSRIALLQARLLRIIQLQLNFFPGEVVRRSLESGEHFDLRQCVFDAFVERLWRFYDAPGYEALPREMTIPAGRQSLHWRVQELCARIDYVGQLKGNPHDMWLCIDNMVFNAIDALSRADRRQLQPLAQYSRQLPALLLDVHADDARQRVSITLRNRGPQIAAELLDGDQVWQLRAAHADEGGGHRGRGIGLYCIKQIIDAGYGGDVIIENIANDEDRCSVELQFADGSRHALQVRVCATDAAPLIAVSADDVAHALPAPVAEHAWAAEAGAAPRRLAALAVDGVATAPDAADGIVIDPRDAMAPRWYAVVCAASVRFVPIDQRGVQVSLHIPASKFLSLPAAAG